MRTEILYEDEDVLVIHKPAEAFRPGHSDR